MPNKKANEVWFLPRVNQVLWHNYLHMPMFQHTVACNLTSFCCQGDHFRRHSRYRYCAMYQGCGPLHAGSEFDVCRCGQWTQMSGCRRDPHAARVNALASGTCKAYETAESNLVDKTVTVNLSIRTFIWEGWPQHNMLLKRCRFVRWTG
jgi:hypothetical protein